MRRPAPSLGPTTLAKGDAQMNDVVSTEDAPKLDAPKLDAKSIAELAEQLNQ
jgi:hypothetical protein